MFSHGAKTRTVEGNAMRIRMAVSGLLTGALMAALVLFAPVANAAAGVCGDLPDRRLHKTITKGTYVFRGWTSASVDKVCWVVKRKDGKRLNVDMYAERDFVDETKGTVSDRRQFWNVRKVTRYHKTTGAAVKVQIYAGAGGSMTNPMRYIGTMKFPAE